MCYLTYNLKGGNENSNEYYEKVKTVKNQVINSLFNKSLVYISDFSNYITINSIENLRTDKEYFIEFLLIGVLKKEYDSFVDNINLQEEILLKLLNKYRNINIIKSFMDKFRGVMNTKILIIIFLPACMRQQDRKCMSRKCRNGYKCVGCSSLCNVNRLRRLGEIYNFYVRVIPHETDMNSIKNYDNNSYGIVGIACIINLVSGGFKALRLGFIPQCVLLEQVGCKNHWLLNKGNMTEINEERLLHILTKF